MKIDDLCVTYKINEKGFTLIELLVTLTLSVLVFSGLMSVYWVSHYSYTRQQNQADVQYSARQAYDAIAKDIRACRGFVVWSSLNTPVNSPGANGGWLKLQVDNSNQGIIYYTSSHTLFRNNTTTSPANNLAVASNIESIIFSSPAPKLINITITARAGDQVYTLTGSMKKRVD